MTEFTEFEKRVIRLLVRIYNDNKQSHNFHLNEDIWVDENVDPTVGGE